MLKNFCCLALCLVLFACSKEEEGNSVPSGFELEDLSFNGTAASISWSTAKDADEDDVYYNVYLNSELIEGPITKNYLSTTVEYNKDYEGTIIATDQNGGTSELKFDFRSPTSKIALVTDFQSAHVVAIDLHTHQRLWTARTEERVNNIQNGLVFSGFENLIARNIITGEKVWEAQPVESDYYTGYRDILADDKFLYAKAQEASLICVDLERQEKQWEVHLSGSISRFSMDKDHLYATQRGTDDLIKINKISGETAWGFELDRPVGSLAPQIEHAPLIYNGNIFFQDNNGRFYSVNKHTGTKNYSLYNRKNSQTTPVAFNQNIIFTAGDEIISVKAETGEITWKNSFGMYSQSSPFVENGKVYLGAGDKVYCFDATTGLHLWETSLGGEIWSSPVVYDGKVYISSHTARLHCINAATGEIEWKEGNVEFSVTSPTLVIGETEKIIYSSDHGMHL